MKQPSDPAGAAVLAPVQFINVADIVPDPHNRKEHDKAKLQLLADEIALDGLLQPIVVRPIDGRVARYQIIAGERRWRAFQLLKRVEIPATVCEGEVQKTATRKRVAENFHREDLTPIEKARDLAQLFTDGLTQAEVATFVGAKDQSTISNMMRLLKLPQKVQAWLQDGSLSAAHGKALLRFEGRDKLIEAIAERAIDQGASTKTLEKGLPFAEQLVEDDFVHCFGYLARTLKDIPKEYQADTDFIVSLGEYDTEYVYCLDPEKGERVHAQLETARETRRAEQNSAANSERNGGGMTAAQLAERKKQIEKNKSARAAINATFGRAWAHLKSAGGLDDLGRAIRVVLGAATENYNHSKRVKEAAGALGLKAGSDREFDALSTSEAVRVVAMAVLMRRCDDAKRMAGDVPEAATQLAAGAVKLAPPAARPAKPKTPNPKPKTSGKAKRRAVITDDTRYQVKRFTEQGKTGAEIAKAVGISLPSVQNIKKALGLVRR